MLAAILQHTRNNVHGFVEGRNEAEPIHVQLVSGTYFSTLGVQRCAAARSRDADDRTEGAIR